MERFRDKLIRVMLGIGLKILTLLALPFLPFIAKKLYQVQRNFIDIKWYLSDYDVERLIDLLVVGQTPMRANDRIFLPGRFIKMQNEEEWMVDAEDGMQIITIVRHLNGGNTVSYSTRKTPGLLARMLGFKKFDEDLLLSLRSEDGSFALTRPMKEEFKEWQRRQKD